MIARILALGLMSAAAAVSQAETASADDVPTVHVHYQDLDLNTEKGAMTLYKRIEGAAKAVCPWSNGLDIRASRAADHCVATAVSRAVSEVNNPQLAKLDALRSRRA